MSDIYYHDTNKALIDFNYVVGEALEYLKPQYQEIADKLTNEVELLLREYEDKIERVEKLESILEDSGIDYDA